jgi:hypothetical protein
MATRFIFLPKDAELPGSNAPQLTTINDRPVLAFDASTDESCYWTAIAPQNLSGALTAVVYYVMASATSGAVAFQLALEAITPTDALDLDATTGFATATDSGDSVPATAGYMSGQIVTLANTDSIAPADLFRLRFNRDADHAGDTATGDMLVLAIEFRDAA